MHVPHVLHLDLQYSIKFGTKNLYIITTICEGFKKSLFDCLSVYFHVILSTYTCLTLVLKTLYYYQL